MTRSLPPKEAMIISAERLFAIHGMEGVSMRQIALDAGQRNESAAVYHFGTREGLIRAILDHRIPALDVRRRKLLDDAKRTAGGTVTGRMIASIFVLPIADEVFSNWRKCYWVRFISQLWSIEKFQHLAEKFQSSSPALSEANDLVLDIPNVDLSVLKLRRDILRRNVVWGLSRVEAMSFHESQKLCELHVANLIDMIAASISTASSEDTLMKVKNLSRQKVKIALQNES